MTKITKHHCLECKFGPVHICDIIYIYIAYEKSSKHERQRFLFTKLKIFKFTFDQMFSSRFNFNPFLMKMAKLLLKKKGEGVKCNMFVINYNCILGIKNKSLMSYGLVQLLVIYFQYLVGLWC
jgi:hypothetical protein